MLAWRTEAPLAAAVMAAWLARSARVHGALSVCWHCACRIHALTGMQALSKLNCCPVVAPFYSHMLVALPFSITQHNKRGTGAGMLGPAWHHRTSNSSIPSLPGSSQVTRRVCTGRISSHAGVVHQSVWHSMMQSCESVHRSCDGECVTGRRAW